MVGELFSHSGSKSGGRSGTKSQLLFNLPNSVAFGSRFRFSLGQSLLHQMLPGFSHVSHSVSLIASVWLGLSQFSVNEITVISYSPRKAHIDVLSEAQEGIHCPLWPPATSLCAFHCHLLTVIEARRRPRLICMEAFISNAPNQTLATNIKSISMSYWTPRWFFRLTQSHRMPYWGSN